MAKTCEWYGCVKEIIFDEDGEIISVELEWQDWTSCKPTVANEIFRKGKKLTKSIAKAAQVAIGRCVAVGVIVTVDGATVTYDKAAVAKYNKKCCECNKETKEGGKFYYFS